MQNSDTCRKRYLKEGSSCLKPTSQAEAPAAVAAALSRLPSLAVAAVASRSRHRAASLLAEVIRPTYTAVWGDPPSIVRLRAHSWLDDPHSPWRNKS
eukprot:4673700-Pleurochrysis_carterae.AAC.2